MQPQRCSGITLMEKLPGEARHRSGPGVPPPELTLLCAGVITRVITAAVGWLLLLLDEAAGGVLSC